MGFGSSAFYQGSLLHVESEDQNIQNSFEFSSNEVYSNKAIGPETSLIYFKDLKYVDINGNRVKWNGYLSDLTFTPPQLSFTPLERVSSSEQADYNYA